MVGGGANINQGNASRRAGEQQKTERPCPLCLMDMSEKLILISAFRGDTHGISTAVSCPGIDENTEYLDHMGSIIFFKKHTLAHTLVL